MIVRGIQPRRVLSAALVLAVVSALAVVQDAAAAPASAVTVHSANIVSEFPTGFRVRLTADSPNQIDSLAIRLRIGQQTRTGYDYLEFAQQGQSIDAELLWRTNTAANYIPPGTVITYRFEFVDVEGGRLETDYATFTYHDPRFAWREISEGPVTVSYHGRSEPRATDILRASIDTLNRMSPLLGADADEPVRVTVYNTWDEMRHAIPPSNSTVGRRIITEGQAFTNIGTLLVLGSRSAAGTASHEMAHIVVHRAGEGPARKVPPWLHEGLAEYANIDPGTSYDAALQRAIRHDRLLPVTRMGTLPGRPDDVILFYGQSKALVRMMIDDFGPEKMRELMARYKDGASMDRALEQTYRLDRDGIENRLRRSLGTSLLPASNQASQRPTPLPAPTVLPYTLQPDENGRFVGGSDDMRVSETAPNSPSLPITNSNPLPRPNTPVPLVYAAPPTSNSQPSAPADAGESSPYSARGLYRTPVLADAGKSSPYSAEELYRTPALADAGEPSPSTAPQVTTSCAAPAGSAPLDLAAAGAIIGLAVLRTHALRRPSPKTPRA